MNFCNVCLNKSDKKQVIFSCCLQSVLTDYISKFCSKEVREANKVSQESHLQLQNISEHRFPFCHAPNRYFYMCGILIKSCQKLRSTDKSFIVGIILQFNGHCFI